MFVRIIAGKYGSRKIEAPDNSRTHPMGERVRNAMFNSIGAEIDGKDVLDAFAGTGAIGLEALSRGARTITFVERDKIALKILTKILYRCRLRTNRQSLEHQSVIGSRLKATKSMTSFLPIRHTTICSYPQFHNYLLFSNPMGLWYYPIQEEVRCQILKTELLWWTIVVMEMHTLPPSAEVFISTHSNPTDCRVLFYI
jgi:16S rRNA G966 N2-methylase RsmD